MGLALGLPAYDLPVQSLYAAILVAAVYIVDHPKILRTHNKQTFSMVTDWIEIDPAQLQSRVEAQLGHQVKKVSIRSVTTNPAAMKLEIES